MSVATNKMLDEKFQQWVQGKDATQARVSIFEKVRDIPHAVIPELCDAERYVDILKLGRGSCTPKHFLLGKHVPAPQHDGTLCGLPLPMG